LMLNFSNNFASLPTIKFHSTRETLKKIEDIISKKEKGVYLRFGDGDVNLANGQGELLQRANRTLTNEMREAFAIGGKNVVKCLFIHCKQMGNWEQGMSDGNHETDYPWSINLLKKAIPHWKPKVNVVYSPVALHYLASTDPKCAINFLKFLKSSNCCLLVGNKNIPVQIIDLLFGTQCQFVSTPPVGSYSEIDRIEKECLAKIGNTNEYKVIITAMGCSGRVLQKRLWNKLNNVFLFDFGSLMDAICGWNTRQWIETSNINIKQFLQMLCQEMNYELPCQFVPEKLKRMFY
jgi:hypothetical protein